LWVEETKDGGLSMWLPELPAGKEHDIAKGERLGCHQREYVSAHGRGEAGQSLW